VTGPFSFPRLGRLLGVNELAVLLHRSPRAIYHLRERGVLPPAIRVGKTILWPADEILLWLDSNREEVNR
jgi:predicted DNA-binding transcriptional regulator AlpA